MKYIFILFVSLFCLSVEAQVKWGKKTTPQPQQQNSNQGNSSSTSSQSNQNQSTGTAPQSSSQQNQTKSQSQSQIESVWISGGLGAGGVVSTNVINSGALFFSNLELAFQKRHHRLGLGFGNELNISAEALARWAMGEGIGQKKLYFIYEAYVFRNFPINLGFSSHLGFFAAGNESSNRGGAFGNVGATLELGARPVYFFVRPCLEYKSWSGFHKEIAATATVGLKLKFLTDYEIQRRADKRHDRDHKN